MPGFGTVIHAFLQIAGKTGSGGQGELAGWEQGLSSRLLSRRFGPK
jgi:hypothetical protein